MLVVEIDHIDAEALEARVACLRDILGPPVDAIGLAVAPRLAELGGEHDALAPPLDGSADDILVLAPTVHVGRVQMIDTLVDGITNEVLGCRILRGPVDAGQRHTAKADY